MENTAKVTSNPLPTTSVAAVPPSAPHDWVFDIAESARKGEKSLQNFISENPVRSVAIAVGLGFTLNLVLKSLSANKQEQSL